MSDDVKQKVDNLKDLTVNNAARDYINNSVQALSAIEGALKNINKDKLLASNGTVVGYLSGVSAAIAKQEIPLMAFGGHEAAAKFFLEKINESERVSDRVLKLAGTVGELRAEISNTHQEFQSKYQSILSGIQQVGVSEAQKSSLIKDYEEFLTRIGDLISKFFPEEFPGIKTYDVKVKDQ